MNTTYTCNSSSEEEDNERKETHRPPLPKIKVLSSEKVNEENEEVPTSSSKKLSKYSPTYATMVIKAIKVSQAEKGASVQAIKAYLNDAYNVKIDNNRTKQLLKKTIDRFLEDGSIIRVQPTRAGASSVTGLRGRFKIVEKKKKKVDAEKRHGSQVKRLNSVKEKSYAVQMAQKKVRQARISLTSSSPGKVGKIVKKMSPIKKTTKKTIAIKAAKTKNGKSQKNATTKKANSGTSKKSEDDTKHTKAPVKKKLAESKKSGPKGSKTDLSKKTAKSSK